MGIVEDLKELDIAAGQYGYTNKLAQPNSTNNQLFGQGPKPPLPDAPIPVEEGLPPTTEAAQNTAEGQWAENLIRGAATNYPGFSSGPPPVVQPALTNPNVYGGKELVDKITQGDPAALSQAMSEGAQAQQDEGDALKAFYEKAIKEQSDQNTLFAQRRMERSDDITRRQAEIDTATQRYTADLADRGQFWKNPWNVMSAFVTSFMALTGDPQAGIRLINQQILNDWNQRREIANTSLGAMRSNLESYRQIAGDRDQGDLLALRESYRIAALELPRIAAQFQGPKARAQAAVAQKELMYKADLLTAQLHKQGMYQPGMLMPKWKSESQKAEGVTPIGNGKFPGQEGSVTPLGGIQGARTPSGGQGASVGVSGGTTQNSSIGMPSTGNPNIDNWLKAQLSPISGENASRLNQRYPGMADRVNSAKMAEGIQILKRVGPDPVKIRAAMAEKEKEWDEGKAKIAAAVTAEKLPGRMRLYRYLADGMKRLESMAMEESGGKPVDMNKFMRMTNDVIFGRNLMNKWEEVANALEGPAKTAEQAKIQSKRRTIEEFKQLLAGGTNEYIKEHAGGTVPDGEQARMDLAIKRGWDGIRTFLDSSSANANAQFDAVLSGFPIISQEYYKAATGLSSSKLDTRGVRPPEFEGPRPLQPSKIGTPDYQNILDSAVRNLGRVNKIGR